MSQLVSIETTDKQPFNGIAGHFGVQDDDSVRGLCLPVKGSGIYISLRAEGWRYWSGRYIDDAEDDTFAEAVRRLIPLTTREYVRRLNGKATGSLESSYFGTSPEGSPFIYDLEDKAIVERFALTCAVGESLAAVQKLLAVYQVEGETRVEAAKVVQNAIPSLNINVSLWGLDSAGQAVVFFPDCVLLRRAKFQWVIPYSECAVRVQDKQHPRTDQTPSDTGEGPDGTAIYSEVTLGLSDQRLKLQVSSPACAKRLKDALDRLLATAQEEREARHKLREIARRNKPRRKKREKRRRLRSAFGIVVKEKDKNPSLDDSQRIVVKLRTGDPPPADPADGLTVPEPEEQEELALSDREGWTVRGATGAVMAYVAKGDYSFSAEEQGIIREVLALPRGFDLERRFREVARDSSGLDGACARIRKLPRPERMRIFGDCERVAWIDGRITRGEHMHLSEMREALKVDEDDPEPQPEPAPAASASEGSVADKIRDLARLKDDGLLSEEEFEQRKKDLLDRL